MILGVKACLDFISLGFFFLMGCFTYQSKSSPKLNNYPKYCFK